MRNIVFDASSVVGVLLKQGSVPDRALLLARATGTICMSSAVEHEIREVLNRPKFRRHIEPGRISLILFTLLSAARQFEPVATVSDCRDPTDNIYLELALAAGAEVIVSSDDDLRTLHPWRGIAIVSPATFVTQRENFTAPAPA